MLAGGVNWVLRPAPFTLRRQRNLKTEVSDFENVSNVFHPRQAGGIWKRNNNRSFLLNGLKEHSRTIVWAQLT